MPLYQGGALNSREREAAALCLRSKEDLENARRNAALAARQNYLMVINGIAVVAALEQALVSSQSALDSNKLGYEVGVRINIDVLNAQQQLFLTRRDLPWRATTSSPTTCASRPPPAACARKTSSRSTARSRLDATRNGYAPDRSSILVVGDNIATGITTPLLSALRRPTLDRACQRTTRRLDQPDSTLVVSAKHLDRAIQARHSASRCAASLDWWCSHPLVPRSRSGVTDRRLSRTGGVTASRGGAVFSLAESSGRRPIPPLKVGRPDLRALDFGVAESSSSRADQRAPAGRVADGSWSFSAARVARQCGAPGPAIPHPGEREGAITAAYTAPRRLPHRAVAESSGACLWTR